MTKIPHWGITRIERLTKMEHITKLDDAMELAKNLAKESEILIRKVGMEDYDYPQEIDRKGLTADERFQLEQLSNALNSLQKFSDIMEYLKKPIKAEGMLYKNSSGRYELSEVEYTCGYSIEYLIYDDFEEREEWRRSCIEHNGEDYYIVGDKNIKLDGLHVRVR